MTDSHQVIELHRQCMPPKVVGGWERNLRDEREELKMSSYQICPVLGARPICMISARQLAPLQKLTLKVITFI